ncbi:MAG: ABC transporter permease [Tannerella sp.]|jgi:putative ABC transport system permease protein|nr:ABC transporter permease [Tannerella sp.]
MILKHIQKGKSLRIVNLLGLSIIFSCLILSFIYIKKELSYDCFNENADRIVRFSIRFNDDPVDGRNWGYNKNHPAINDIPEIEDAVFMVKVYTGVISFQGKNHVVNDWYSASSNFFDVFSYQLIEGDKSTVLDAPEKVVISRKMTKQLFGNESPIGKELILSGETVFVSGVFEDIPETSHFHTDLIVHRKDNDNRDWAYIYFLLNKQADFNKLRENINIKLNESYADVQFKASAYLLPLTDIHLHSRIQREMEPNGNIYYVYLVAGANILLLLIVLFNLWLNAGLIFSYNKKYYQLLRLNGAPAFVVLKDESILAIILGILSVLLGGLVANFLFSNLNMSSSILTGYEIAFICLLFLILVYIISLLPVLTKLSSTAFLNTNIDLRAANFSLSNVKFMLIAQYAIVMFIVIVGFGISKQMNLVKTSQVGGKEKNVLVTKQQPNNVKEKYDLFKSELLKYPEIESVTAAMQLPGSAIRDMMGFRKEGETIEDSVIVPILVVGDDFLPFFNIKLIAGNIFHKSQRSYDAELQMVMKYFSDNPETSDQTEEYIINHKAMQMLGFNSPEEAIGKRLYSADNVSYINNGTIIGVTEDFIYTTTYEDSIPQVLLQRKMFLHCMMIRLNPDNLAKGVETFNRVWNDIYPDYPANYTFLQDVYSHVYHNELNAESIVHIFSLLSLVIANLGLIIIMAFIIKRKTKEIGIRKVNGATPVHIVKLLNNQFVKWIGAAFLIAIPLSWYVMNRWLENFAHKTSLNWWMFAIAGLFVFLLSAISISWQSWHAANLNPVKSLKTE